MSQIYKQPAGTPGAAPVEFLQGNVGPKIGPDGTGTINTDGPPTAGAYGIANLWPITTTGVALGNYMYVEDRTFLSACVVDSSTTMGERGTYSTIQSAITNYAAVVGTGTNVATIYIRPGTYSENPVIPDSVNIQFIGVSTPNNNAFVGFFPVVVDGNWTQGASPGQIYFENIYFTDSSGGTAQFDVTTSYGYLGFYGCAIDKLSITSGSINFYNCQTSDNTVGGTSQAFWQSCPIVGNVALAATGRVVIKDSENTGSITGTGTQVSLYNSSLASPAACTAPIYYSEIFDNSTDTSNLKRFFDGSQSALKALPSTAGTVYNGITTAIDYTILPTDQYVGVTTRVAARTMTLPIANVGFFPQCNKYQIFIIHDESGQNGTYPITIVPNASPGGTTIDGASSYVMNIPYQTVVLMNVSQGATNNWVVLWSSSASGSSSWSDVTGATTAMIANNNYVTDRGGGVTYTLPATASFGDVIKVDGKLGLTTIAQNANQQIRVGSSTSTVGVGGSIAGTNVGDCITLRCTTGGTSTVWIAEGGWGNWTVT